MRGSKFENQPPDARAELANCTRQLYQATQNFADERHYRLRLQKRLDSATELLREALADATPTSRWMSEARRLVDEWDKEHDE